jgi:nitroreductase
MNETIALLRTRRSVPPQLLNGPGPNPAELEQILTIAARVPDHGKLVPWRFIVIAGDARAQLGEVAATALASDDPQTGEERLAIERGRFTRAPLVIAVVSRARPHPKIPQWEQTLSAGAAAMNLVVAANAMGFATSWITEWCAYDRRILDELGLDPQERIAGFVHVGRSETRPADRDRPELAAIITHYRAS